MRILDRYILGELALPFLTGIMAVIVMLVGNTLFAIIDPVLQNNIPLVVVARLIVFNIPTLLVLTLPVAVALASAMVVNRLARDSEITAMRMTGTPLMRLFAPIIAVGLLASITSFWLGESVVPPSERAFQKTQSAMLGYALTAAPVLISNRVFTYQNYEFHVREATRGVPGRPNALLVKDVLIVENPTTPNGFARLFTAKRAITENGLWTLYDVVTHFEDDRGFTRLETHADTATLDLRAPLPVETENTNGSMIGMADQYSLAELSRQIRDLGRSGQNTTSLRLAYQYKFALPFLCLAFALCAPPIVMRFARTGSFVGIFLSIVMIFVAWNTLLLARALGIKEWLPAPIAAWAPDLLFFVVGLWSLRSME